MDVMSFSQGVSMVPLPLKSPTVISISPVQKQFKKGNTRNGLMKIDALYYVCRVEEASKILKDYKLPLSNTRLYPTDGLLSGIIFRIPLKRFKTFAKFYLYSEETNTFFIRGTPDENFEEIKDDPQAKLFHHQALNTFFFSERDACFQFVDMNEFVLDFSTFMSCPFSCRDNLIECLASWRQIQAEGLAVSCERSFEIQLMKTTSLNLEQDLKLRNLDLNLKQERRNKLDQMRKQVTLEFFNSNPRFYDVSLEGNRISISFNDASVNVEAALEMIPSVIEDITISYAVYDKRE